jgi:hypothetical protein
MDRITYILCLAIFLASCAPTPAPVTVTVPGLPTIILTGTQKSIPTLESTSTALPPTRTATPVPCDPIIAGFCVTDGHFYFQRPILPPGNDSVERTYPYASTANGTRDPHHGVEFENEMSTPVYAAADGQVIFAGSDSNAIYGPWPDYYGNLVVIRHKGNLFTLYAHLSKVDVEVGEFIGAGEKIGEVGRSGGAIGSHLHFEVRRGRVDDYFSTVNPELWLVPSPGGLGAIALSIVNEEGRFQEASITLQRYSSSTQLVEAFYLDSYHPSLAAGEENAGIGDLPAGRYRITLIINGHLYELWVEVQSGKLTQVVIVVE